MKLNEGNINIVVIWANTFQTQILLKYVQLLHVIIHKSRILTEISQIPFVIIIFFFDALCLLPSGSEQHEVLLLWNI